MRSSRDSEAERGGSSGETKSLKDGPVLRRSLKLLAGLGRVDVLVGGGGSVTAVANGRRRRHEGWTGLRRGSVDEASRRVVGRIEAMVACW